MRLGARLVVLGAIFGADRLTKLWALRWLRPRATVPLLPFFSLTYVENTGAAFGIGFSRNGFFIVLSAVLGAVLIYLQRAWRGKNGWVQAGLLLVLGGALGNLYDRVLYGFVVDFLDFRVWPVFNVADSCVSVGACCLAWGMHVDDLRAPGRDL
jgi:signal peptidase II